MSVTKVVTQDFFNNFGVRKVRAFHLPPVSVELFFGERQLAFEIAQQFAVQFGIDSLYYVKLFVPKGFFNFPCRSDSLAVKVDNAFFGCAAKVGVVGFNPNNFHAKGFTEFHPKLFMRFKFAFGHLACVSEIPFKLGFLLARPFA